MIHFKAPLLFQEEKKLNVTEKTKPQELPALYNHVDEFFGKVEPLLDSLLSKFKRRLTLAQTVGSAYHQFQPFLLDYPKMREFLRKTKARDESFWIDFWQKLEEVSVHKQFRESAPLLKETFLSSKTSLQHKNLKPYCDQQKIAHSSLLERIPRHLDPRIFAEAFPEHDAFGRANRITQMQNFCGKIQNEFGMETVILDLYNLTVYRNSFAFHVYKRVTTTIDIAREHAMGLVKITIPHENYIFQQWKEVMSWYGVNEKLAETSKELFCEDPETCRFLITVFCLRDIELKKEAVLIKQQLIRTFLTNKKQGWGELQKIVQQYPFSASHWVRQEIKNRRV